MSNTIQEADSAPTEVNDKITTDFNGSRIRPLTCVSNEADTPILIFLIQPFDGTEKIRQPDKSNR